MASIEVELRSFVSEEQHGKLLTYFKTHGQDKGRDEQETVYFDAPVDVRIQRSTSGAKIWLKKGTLHDDAREEIEVHVPREEFDSLRSLFAALGYKESIIWLRTRNTFIWNGITVTVDFSKGYGHILELEKMADEHSKEKTLEELKAAFAALDIEITPKAVFKERFEHYKKHWRELIA